MIVTERCEVLRPMPMGMKVGGSVAESGVVLLLVVREVELVEGELEVLRVGRAVRRLIAGGAGR